MSNVNGNRLEGIDFARWLAFAGMVLVNFNIVLVTKSSEVTFAQSLVNSLQGKAAALFVVLAGVGLGFRALSENRGALLKPTLIQCCILFLIGLLNQTIFEADIIHYYAVYFLFGILFLNKSAGIIWGAILFLTFVFLAGVFLLDYDAGWNWSAYSYIDFWTFQGFFRNLFFNGWHPVFPWLGFLLFGIWLSRLELYKTGTQLKLVTGGMIAFAIATFLSLWFTPRVQQIDQEATLLLGTAPIPPMPLFVFSAFGIASFIIGSSLLLAPFLDSLRVLRLLTPSGKMTLTLYFAHIFIGMGIMEAAGLLGKQTAENALLYGVLFCLFSSGFAFVWGLQFKRGPLETALRFLSGR